jgi:hypothetical protein
MMGKGNKIKVGKMSFNGFKVSLLAIQMSFVVNEMVEEDRLLSARVTSVGTFCFGLRNHAK